jgi:hypothetical protein
MYPSSLSAANLPNFQRRWSDYYQAVEGRPPRETLLIALIHCETDDLCSIHPEILRFIMETTPQTNAANSRQERYFALIDRLLACPNGEEPQVLNSEPDLLDAGLVKALMQVASYFAHQDNADAARCLIFIARELSVQLGLYPQAQSSS